MFVLDLDDTLINTTRDMRGHDADLSALTLVPGATEFLARYGKQCAVLSSGNAILQIRKLGHFGLTIERFWRISIVPRHELKETEIASIARYGNAPHETIIIGDRLDTEIAMGNRLGCRTARMRLPEGKYSACEPREPDEVADATVTNFFELMGILPALRKQPRHE